MNSAPAPLQRVPLALAILSATRPAPQPLVSRQLPDASALAREIAGHSTELSLALAGMIHSGDATAESQRISTALAAQHDVIRRLHRLPALH